MLFKHKHYFNITVASHQLILLANGVYAVHLFMKCAVCLAGCWRNVAAVRVACWETACQKCRLWYETKAGRSSQPVPKTALRKLSRSVLLSAELGCFQKASKHSPSDRKCRTQVGENPGWDLGISVRVLKVILI